MSRIAIRVDDVVDRDHDDRLTGLLTAWFGSPFWGAPPRRDLVVRARSAPPGAMWDAPHGLVLLAEPIGASG